MKELMKTLVALQTLDVGSARDASSEAVRAALRGKIPAPILGHYDRLVARGKKGLAMVENQVCMGCHMRLPIAVVATLKRGEDIQLCDNCGRYLYLGEESNAPAVEVAAAPVAVRVKRTRKPKSLSAA